MERSDAELVAESLAGSREAFSRIVEQYQSLLCSVAYSATGNLSQSEDLAQEAFIIAWKELRQLREPEKLRPWLCSIARSVVSRAVRRQRRDPSQAAEPIEVASAAAAPGPIPSEGAINREEEAILWRSLEEVPLLYREPLVLFYREGRSVARVAADLMLTEDAVKQRLSRGRKLLHEQVLSLVESTLERSRPGKAFTVVVVGALSAHTLGPASLSVAGASVKGLGVLKPILALGVSGAAVGSLWGWMGGLLGGLGGLAGGLLGIYAPTRLALTVAKTERERQFISRFGREMYWALFVFAALTAAFCALPSLPVPFYLTLLVVYLLFCAGFSIFCTVSGKRFTTGLRQIQKEQGGVVDGAAHLRTLLQRPAGHPLTVRRNYRSKFTAFGLPLVHVAFGGTDDGKCRRGVARGWIAIGDIAFGGVLAVGGVAVGLISVGGLALGGLALGGAAVGALAFGGGAIGGLAVGGGALGVWAVGGLAVGISAFGGAAIAWHAAEGGLAVAHHAAVGGFALALHANDASARGLFAEHSFFSVVQQLLPLAPWLPLMALPAVGLALWFLWKLRRQQPKDSL